MLQRKLIAGFCGLAVTVSSIALAAPALAEEGRGAATESKGSVSAPAKLQNGATANTQALSAEKAFDMPSSYPYQPKLRFFRDNPTGPNGEADFNTKYPELLSHPQLAPELTRLMGLSDRVSTQVIGQSTQGRDLYLVTVTAPESEAEVAQQAAWRDKIRNDPHAAKKDASLIANYKTPIWISNNIHGNEWEGTDAALRYIEYLATAPMSEVGSILRNNRIYFSPSLNPDGRTNATRATAIGLDPNRDMITLQTPEATSFVETADAIQAIYNADFHGYTSVLQMEPTGPPHGSNYEYDLYIPHNYALALAVEKHVTQKRIAGNTYWSQAGPTGSVTNTETDFIKIPYRDTPSGWDDFPPIFTAQYAAFYGTLTATVEIPKGRTTVALPTGNRSLMSPANAVINEEVAYETMVSLVDYLNQPAVAKDLVLNQIETFRRAVDGEPKTALNTGNIADVPGPSQWKEHWDVSDDQEPVTIPRAYVIPVGDDQRSASDANRLVQRLIDIGLEVSKLDADTTVDGTTYAKGSYVIDMHQPLRGLANSLLDLGENISMKLPTMYDISAWSLGYIWGADVAKVGDVTDEPIGSMTRVHSVTPNFEMPKSGEYLNFDLAGVADYQALNALLDEGVDVTMIADGSAVVADTDAAAVAEVAEEFDIAVEKASAADMEALNDPSAKGLTDLKIAYVGNQDDRLSLEELGFNDLVQVTAASLQANPALLDGVNAIWVGSTFTFASNGSQDAGKAAVQAFVDNGGPILGRTSAALNAASAFGLISATATAGNNSGNGIVAVDTPEGSALEPYKQASSFIYPATSFSNLGPNTKAEQNYAAGNPLLAGHWRSTNATNGPEIAGGNASVISGQHATSGAKSMVFGTAVFFRTHPKGGLSQAARGLFWAAPGVDAIDPKAEVSVKLGKSSTRYGQPNTVTVTVNGGGEQASGQVKVSVDGKTVKTIALASGKATVALPANLKAGSHKVTAAFLGSDDVAASSTTVSLKVLKALPKVTSTLAKSSIKTNQNAKVTVKVALPGASKVYATGKVTIKAGSKTVRTFTLYSSKKGTVTVTLPQLKKGTYNLSVRIAANANQHQAVAKKVKLRVS